MLYISIYIFTLIKSASQVFGVSKFVLFSLKIYRVNIVQILPVVRAYNSPESLSTVCSSWLGGEREIRRSRCTNCRVSLILFLSLNPTLIYHFIISFSHSIKVTIILDARILYPCSPIQLLSVRCVFAPRQSSAFSVREMWSVAWLLASSCQR